MLFEWFNNRANITFLIAVAGFIISIINFVENRVASRRSIAVTLKFALASDETLLINMEFTNKSRLPISISSGKLVLEGGKQYSFGNKSNTQFVYSNPAISEKTTERTQRFPLKLEPLSTSEMFVEIDQRDKDWGSMLPCKCNAIFGTSRGRIKTSCEIPVSLDNWKQMLQRLR
ncbi:hypothetical protein SAMN02745823_02714 [Sporobacter termitidis DSM 10068]|uniref:Uncharacterized protein n=1 Tax=Sporobacter termitidis DSM 10068 TaxID=1123282 RepID=A0A1M5YP30_9FIRM|nr:hypothetical protein [Sporobacter termitidis]SHI13640.1 hypothetical protein SAMN02745823_02714 [Sporobacter termitidis DSM 10068]